MAVGYERLNTSAARSKRVAVAEIDRSKISVIDKGCKIWDATYKSGITIEAFVSDSDTVRCQFGDRIVKLEGRAVRCAIENERNRR